MRARAWGRAAALAAPLLLGCTDEAASGSNVASRRAADAASDAGLDADAPYILGEGCEPVGKSEGGPAPELDGGLAWLNTDAPITLDDLRGYVVLFDFWTYGCINCLHQLPVLREIEDALEGEPFVTIGVHSAKFSTEGEVQSIRLAIEQYGVRHPVVVDSEMAIWSAFHVFAWPTTVIVDALGRVRKHYAGELSSEALLPQLRELIDEARANCSAEPEPRSWLTDPTADHSDPLLFPNSVLAMPGDQLAIADSAHHRVAILSRDGLVVDLIGSGLPGAEDGPFATARFARPVGLALYDGKLYIADADNHTIREANLTERTLTTVAGTGAKGDSFVTDFEWLAPRETGLRSPWDLEPVTGGLAVAMAGSHQLFFFDPAGDRIRLLSGNAFEGSQDGSAGECTFAQPNGLAADASGALLYVADTEASAVREVRVDDGSCKTLVGQGLFASGDQDGTGDQVLLQHAAGIELLPDGQLLLADTYNHKLKQLDPATRTVTTLPWPSAATALAEPRGVSRDGDWVFIADSNHHRVVQHDLAAGASSVFDLGDLAAPALFGAATQ